MSASCPPPLKITVCRNLVYTMATCIWPWGRAGWNWELMEKHPSFRSLVGNYGVFGTVSWKVPSSTALQLPTAGTHSLTHSSGASPLLCLMNPLLYCLLPGITSTRNYSHPGPCLKVCFGETELRQRQEKNRKILEKKAWGQEVEYDWQEGRPGGKGEMEIQLSGRKKRPERKCQLH